MTDPSKEEIEEYRDAFALFDKDSDGIYFYHFSLIFNLTLFVLGSITWKELKVVLVRLGMQFEDKRIQQMIRGFDENGKNTRE